MKDTKTIDIIKCDICGDEVDYLGSAEWVYTCSRCGENFCVRCGDNYQGSNSSAYFSLCNKCIDGCGIKNQKDVK